MHGWVPSLSISAYIAVNSVSGPGGLSYLVRFIAFLNSKLLFYPGPVEADPEYLLIVDANNLAAEIDSETNTIHKFARYRTGTVHRYPQIPIL